MNIILKVHVCGTIGNCDGCVVFENHYIEVIGSDYYTSNRIVTVGGNKSFYAAN